MLLSKDTTMKEALDAILSRKNKGIFVVDRKHHLEGIVSVSDLTNLWTADEEALEDLMSRVPLANILKTTRASLLYEAPFHPISERLRSALRWKNPSIRSHGSYMTNSRRIKDCLILRR